MKKYVFLGLFTFVALISMMEVNNKLIFPGLTSDEFIMSMTFFEVMKVCGLEAIIGTGVTWIIGIIFFSEKH